MDQVNLKLMAALVRLFTKLKPGQTVTREQLIDHFANQPQHEESESTLRHAYRHYVKHRGISNAHAVVSYEEAAKLSGRTVDALRAAAYRGSLRTTTEHHEIGGNYRKRTGMFLYELGEFCGWSCTQFEKAAKQVAKWRAGEVG